MKRLSMPPATAAAVPLLALALLVALPAAAQQADAVLRDFQITGDFVLVVDGQEQPNAEIYKSELVPALMVIADKLASPTLVLPRERSVQTVGFMKVLKRGDGFADVLADATLNPVGSFTLDGEDVVFSVDGESVRLKPRPYLLGLQGLHDMLDSNPEYRRGAAGYEPDESVVAALKKTDKAVRVRIYFGSWCPFCKRYVPHALKVAEELQGSKVAFEFYGLPHAFNDEPAAKRDGIDGVPTGIVYVNGKEVGRITTNDWREPEAALRRLVQGS